MEDLQLVLEVYIYSGTGSTSAHLFCWHIVKSINIWTLTLTWTTPPSPKGTKSNWNIISSFLRDPLSPLTVDETPFITKHDSTDLMLSLEARVLRVESLEPIDITRSSESSLSMFLGLYCSCLYFLFAVFRPLQDIPLFYFRKRLTLFGLNRLCIMVHLHSEVLKFLAESEKVLKHWTLHSSCFFWQQISSIITEEPVPLAVIYTHTRLRGGLVYILLQILCIYLGFFWLLCF